jgi:hypothetical protein
MSGYEKQPLISKDVERGPDLLLCDAISFLTKVSAVLVCIAQIVSIAYDSDMSFVKVVLRIYGAVFAVSMFFIELDSSILRTFVVFQNWKSR